MVVVITLPLAGAVEVVGRRVLGGQGSLLGEVGGHLHQ